MENITTHEIFSASLDELRTILQFVRKEIKSINFEINKKFPSIELAIEEAIVNIIKHGYPKAKGVIEIFFTPFPNGLKIVLKDQGIAYNPLLNFPDLSLKTPIDKLHIGGYGIYLIVNIMDEVNYRREEDSNILTLVKYRS